jgi:hypothetical protein
MNQRSPQGNRRRRDRVSVRATAAIKVFGLLPNDQAFGHVINVSETGILVRTPQPPPVGQKAIVRAAAGEQLFEMRALVVRVDKLGRGGFDVALQFASSERQQLKFLRAFLVKG